MIVPERVKALVVDDNAYARAVTAASLRKLGLTTIDEAEGAAAAVGLVLATAYDVMFMDWYMPEMSGAAMLEVIRGPAFPPSGRLPVVMMTAYPSREVFSRARALGVAEVLTKPFTPGHVATALGRVLPDGWRLPEEPDEGRQVLL